MRRLGYLNWAQNRGVGGVQERVVYKTMKLMSSTCLSFCITHDIITNLNVTVALLTRDCTSMQT